VDPITRNDLDEALAKQRTDIEKLFDAKLEPIIETLKFHKKTLYGTKGSNGIVSAVKVLQWGCTVLSGVLIFFAKSFFEL